MPTPLDVVRERLRTFADAEAADESPLYEHLARASAEDDDVAGLLTGVDPAAARVTLLLAAVHRLVLADPVCDLAQYYPSVGGECGVDGRTWPVFREFVLDRAEKVRALLASRVTQTNEVRRAALLYPALALIAKQAGGPLGLLEVGASAGLLLAVDRYGYRYQAEGGEPVTAGPAKAPLVLTSVLSLGPGARKPPLPRKLAVAARVGLDRDPVDLTDEEQLAWLEACVWPDQPERVRLLNLAAAAQAKQPPELIRGDAVDDLAAAAAKVPAELPLVVFNSHVLPYLSPERRRAYVDALGGLAAERPLWWVAQEAYEAGLDLVLPDRPDLAHVEGTKPRATLALTRWTAGTPQATPLARTAYHGERLEWLAK